MLAKPKDFSLLFPLTPGRNCLQIDTLPTLSAHS
jgi:hypothetical protein